MRDAVCQRIVCGALSMGLLGTLPACAGVQRGPAPSIVPEDEEALLYDCGIMAVQEQGYELDGSDPVLRHFRTNWQQTASGDRVRLRVHVYTSNTMGPGMDVTRERQTMRDGAWDVAPRDDGEQVQKNAVLASVRSCWEARSVHGDGARP